MIRIRPAGNRYLGATTKTDAATHIPPKKPPLFRVGLLRPDDRYRFCRRIRRRVTLLSVIPLVPTSRLFHQILPHDSLTFIVMRVLPQHHLFYHH